MLVQPPTGTVTFLFTDIEGSTRLWEQRPDEMRAAVTRHDSVLRSCVAMRGGFVVKSTGDGLMAAFADASEAVTAAVDAQRAIADERWVLPVAVRMGLHTGTAVAVDGDYHAPTVNRAARVAAAAHAGQILVTAATAAVAEGHVFRDLGDHRLKGLPAMRLLQVEAEGLLTDFPALTSLSPLVQIPASLTTFIGRNAEVDAVGKLLERHRVVTLTGIGGCGKTRLAIESASRFATRFEDGVRFVDLSPVADESLVVSCVVAAVGLAEDPSTNPLERLADYLAVRAMLIVLDNCEHLLEICAQIADTVGARSKSSRLLMTSREPLAVLGEQVHTVRSLTDSEAIQLFGDRAAHVRESFVVDDTNELTVAAICHRLDGIPLAIELAAAQLTHLNVVQILDRLNDRFRLLVGGRGRVQRQQTLAATLDWSHGMLNEEEQMTFRRLATFSSTFSVEAAQAVVADLDVEPQLRSLISKSLVVVIDDVDQFRYRMLETVRLYAEERLLVAGESQHCRDRHRDWLVEWLESMPLEHRWFGDTDVLRAELPNIRAALEWSFTQGDFEALARIASGVDWSRSGAQCEGLSWCERLAGVDLPKELNLRVLTTLTILSVTRLDSRAYSRASDAVSAADGEPSPCLSVALGWFATILAVRAVSDNDSAAAASAIAAAERAVSMSEAYEAPWQMYCRFLAGMTRASLSTARLTDGHSAESQFRLALAIAPKTPAFGALRATVYEYLALFRLLAGDPYEAVALAQHAPSGDGHWPMFGPNQSAVRFLALAATGSKAQARRELEQLYETFRRVDVVRGRDTVCMYAGAMAAVDGNWERAARLLAAGRNGIRAGAEAALVYFHYRDIVRVALGPDRARQLRNAGATMPIDEAINVALQ